MVFKAEVSPPEWETFTANPVRAVAEHLRNSGFRARLEAPFGATFVPMAARACLLPVRWSSSTAESLGVTFSPCFASPVMLRCM